jgi:hypothetical protein
MGKVRRLAAVAAAFLALLPALSPWVVAQEGFEGRRVEDTKRVDEERRKPEDERRMDERRVEERRSIERIGREVDLSKPRNTEFHDADALDAKIKAEHPELRARSEQDARGRERSEKADFTKVNEENQLGKRGWSEGEVRDMIEKNPAGTSIDQRYGKNDPALVFGEPGKYIVQNARTFEIVQVSDKNNPAWRDDPRIKWNK